MQLNSIYYIKKRKDQEHEEDDFDDARGAARAARPSRASRKGTRSRSPWAASGATPSSNEGSTASPSWSMAPNASAPSAAVRACRSQHTRSRIRLVGAQVRLGRRPLRDSHDGTPERDGRGDVGLGSRPVRPGSLRRNLCTPHIIIEAREDKTMRLDAEKKKNVRGKQDACRDLFVRRRVRDRNTRRNRDSLVRGLQAVRRLALEQRAEPPADVLYSRHGERRFRFPREPPVDQAVGVRTRLPVGRFPEKPLLRAP